MHLMKRESILESFYLIKICLYQIFVVPLQQISKFYHYEAGN